MRRATRPLVATLAALLLSPTFAAGQSRAVEPQANPDQQFAAIHDSLLEAADTAIEASAIRQPEMNRAVDAQEAQPQPATDSPKVASQRSSQRVNALRPLVQPILAKAGVPDGLAAVMLVESGGNPLALSPKGARGLWQLMPDTARRYGLTVDGRLDERLNLDKATTGAAFYLRDLYAQFGSWPLALAAYNTGEQNLQRAIDRAHTRDFATLSFLGLLPAETRNYVPEVLAAMKSPDLTIPQNTQKANQANLVYATSESETNK